MGKHKIILVHGMGEHGDGWADGHIEQLAELYGSFRLLPLFASFEQLFEFVQVGYNQFFDERRTQWSTDAGAVIKLLEEGDLQKSAVTEISKIADSTISDDFLATHLLDVFLYRFTPVGEQVRRHLAGTILGTLSADPGPWSIVGHSLGASVVHDALHQLFTDAATGPAMRQSRADLLMMVSNVSRLLEQDGMDVYKTVTHPSADPLAGVCRHFFNVKHEWDPFARPREFRPTDDWPDVVTRQQGRFRKIEINAFASKNIHGLTHYLGNPQVHVPFFRLLSRPDFIPDAEFDEAVARYEANTPLGAFEDLQKKLRALQTSDQATWRQVIKAFKKFFEILSDF